MDHIGFVRFEDEDLSIHVGRYNADGSPAVQLYDSDGPYTTFSVCVPGTALAPGELLAKTWGENMDLRAPMLATGLFQDTGRRVPTGHVNAEVWRFVPTC